MFRTASVVLTVLALGCTAKYIRETTDTPFEVTDERLARGSYLVNHVAACGSCHTTRDSGSIADTEGTEQYLGGGNTYDDRVFHAKVWIPNITSDEETGIGTWTDDQIARAIRDGIRADGTLMSPWMPWTGYQNMSDEDVKAIVVYLRSVPTVKQERERFENEFLWQTKLLLSTGYGHHEPVRNVETPDRNDPIAYGEYIVHIGHCGECHSLKKSGYVEPGDKAWLAGSQVPYIFKGWGTIYARNLTPDEETGLGKYSAEEIKEALRSGRRLDGKRMAVPMKVFNVHYTGMTDEDLDALVTYLKSLPPREHRVPERQLTRAAMNALADD